MADFTADVSIRRNGNWLAWLKEPAVVMVFIYMAVMFVLSSMSLPTTFLPSRFRLLFLNDKIVHGIEYAILTILLIYAFRRLQFRQVIFCAIALAALYGISDEIHQYFVPKRACSFFDWLADVAGSLVMASLYWCHMRIRGLTRPSLQEH